MKTLVTIETEKQRIVEVLRNNNMPIDLDLYDYRNVNVAMGSGGKGQIKFMKKLKLCRLQTTYGKGRWNYADAIEIFLKA